MSPALTLFPEEFTSLLKIGAGHRVGEEPIPAAHLLKLVGLHYIEAVDGHYRATEAGRSRIAEGNWYRPNKAEDLG
jgi:hypothetical protein